MMAFIRHRQRVMTALTPHSQNKTVIVPRRDVTVVPPTTWQTVQTLIAGESGAAGYFLSSYGSLSPLTLDNTAGDTVERIITFGTGTFLEIALAGASVPDTDTTFSSLTLVGTFIGGADTQIFARTDATFYDGITGGRTRWRFPIVNDDRMIDTNTYTVTWDGDL